jgi:hypothetical protein
MQEAAHALGLQIDVLNASTEGQINTAFANLAQLRAGALFVGTSTLFRRRPEQFAALAARQGMPAIYQYREFVAAGGLSAPRWLLHFCMASLDCSVLGIELPKSSEPAPECGRDGLRDMKSWPDLPTGTIGAGRPIPKPNPMRPEERIDLIGLLKSGEENWSRRDRHRYREIMAKVDRDELSRAPATSD